MKINKLNFHKNLLSIIFGIIIVFQLTTLKLSLGLTSLSRIVNIFFTIILFVFLFIAIFKIKFTKGLFYLYFFPGMLIVLGFLINIIKSSIYSVESFGYLSQVLPWMMFLIIPYFVQKNIFKTIDFWEQFSKFILFTTIISLIEYFLALNDLIILKSIESPNGDFLTGKVAIFHKLSDDTPHFRFYSCFMEPGTFAMFLLPLICHAFYFKKFFRIIIFLIAFYFTFSLGGIISLFLMIFLIIIKLYGIKKYLIIFGILFSFIFYFSIFNESLRDAYDEKGNSALEREESLSKTATNFTKLVFNYPFGIPLKSETTENQKNEFYLGTNFIPGVYLQFGGYLAFMGYVVFLFFTTFFSILFYIFKKNLSKEELIYVISVIALFPFIFQRYTIMESSLYAFLFSPFIIKYLTLKIESK